VVAAVFLTADRAADGRIVSPQPRCDEPHAGRIEVA
jgi:hypothetical protein